MESQANIAQQQPRGGRPLVCSCLALALVISTGCLSRAPLAKESFMLSSPASKASIRRSGTGVLAVKAPIVTPPFEGRSFVYRTGENSFERDPYAEFLTSPGRALAKPIRVYLRNSAVFRNVTEPDSTLKPDRRVEVHAIELYGDFRKSTNAAAVLTLRFIFLDGPVGSPDKVKLQMDCARRIELKERTPAALVEGWNLGLEQIMADVVKELKSTTE
jgi:hypothetical protein